MNRVSCATSKKRHQKVEMKRAASFKSCRTIAKAAGLEVRALGFCHSYAARRSSLLRRLRRFAATLQTAVKPSIV
jgi:hypothetical protein